MISLTVLADSIYNILIFFWKKNVGRFCTANKIQHICVSLDVNFNESLTNDVVSFEQLGPAVLVAGKGSAGHVSVSSFLHFSMSYWKTFSLDMFLFFFSKITNKKTLSP